MYTSLLPFGIALSDGRDHELHAIGCWKTRTSRSLYSHCLGWRSTGERWFFEVLFYILVVLHSCVTFADCLSRDAFHRSFFPTPWFITSLLFPSVVVCADCGLYFLAGAISRPVGVCRHRSDVHHHATQLLLPTQVISFLCSKYSVTQVKQALFLFSLCSQLISCLFIFPFPIS